MASEIQVPDLIEYLLSGGVSFLQVIRGSHDIYTVAKDEMVNFKVDMEDSVNLNASGEWCRGMSSSTANSFR